MSFEVSLGDYGKMVFEIMAGETDSQIEHWESIRAEAEPLVRQLLSLNDKMSRLGDTEPYAIIGVLDESGKRTISQNERIRLAQIELWGVTGEDLVVGDGIWVNDGEIETEIDGTPDTVEVVTSEFIYVDRGREGTYKLSRDLAKDGTILRAPDDYEENEDLYNRTYWLEQANRLGI